MTGPPLPRPKEYTKDNDIEYLERSYKRDIAKLENKVVDMSKRLHGRIVDFSEYPNSEIHEGLLQSAYYALHDATIELINFERSNP